jgi:hypothetical protein
MDKRNIRDHGIAPKVRSKTRVQNILPVTKKDFKNTFSKNQDGFGVFLPIASVETEANVSARKEIELQGKQKV